MLARVSKLLINFKEDSFDYCLICVVLSSPLSLSLSITAYRVKEINMTEKVKVFILIARVSKLLKNFR